MPDISINDLVELMHKNPIKIIDIRDSYAYGIGHIASAINIPKNALLANPSKYLIPQETYYLYCNSGSTSEHLVGDLNYIGYHTINIKGGYNNYLLR